MPFILIGLAWHTGFQISFSGDERLVLSAFDVLVPVTILLAFAGHWYVRGSETAFGARLKLPLIAFAIFVVWGVGLALVRAVDPAPLIANLKAYTIYPLIALLLPWCITRWRQLYAAVFWMMTLILERALEGIVQGQAGSRTVILNSGTLVGRINGNFASVNQYALYVATGLLIGLGLLLGQRRLQWRLAYLAASAVLALALSLTLSRGAWLGTVVALVASAFCLGPRRSTQLLAVLALVLAVIAIIHPGTISAVAGRLQLNDNTVKERQQFLQVGFQVVESYPLGAGWGAGFILSPHGPIPADSFPWYHDDYLQLATEVGVPGMLAFVWLWLAILWPAFRTARKLRLTGHGPLILGLLAAVIASLVQAGTDQFFWHADLAPHIWLLTGLLLSALALVHNAGRPNADTAPSAP
jgi:O-antigen ligase